MLPSWSAQSWLRLRRSHSSRHLLRLGGLRALPLHTPAASNSTGAGTIAADTGLAGHRTIRSPKVSAAESSRSERARNRQSVTGIRKSLHGQSIAVGDLPLRRAVQAHHHLPMDVNCLPCLRARRAKTQWCGCASGQKSAGSTSGQRRTCRFGMGLGRTTTER